MSSKSNYSVDKGKISATIDKVKSSPGRKPGYRMKSWQKELQVTSVRNRNLMNFNHFLEDFVDLCHNLEGERFCMEPIDTIEDTFFPQDNVFILEKVVQRDRGFPSDTLFFYRNEKVLNEKICLKAYDQYLMVKEQRLYPAKEKTRKTFTASVKEAAEKKDVVI